MFGNLADPLTIILAAAAIFAAIGIAVAHTGARWHFYLFAMLAWLGLSTGSWLVIPHLLQLTPVSHLAGGLVFPLPSVTIGAAIIRRGQWRSVPENPRVTLALTFAAFVLASLLGFFIAFQVMGSIDPQLRPQAHPVVDSPDQQ